MKNIYSTSVYTLEEKKVSLSEYRGKVLLIVNVASYCGFTNQYRDLQRLYDKYHGKGFEVLAFPCNDFAQQEPRTKREIAEFCRTRFAVSFSLFGKVKILGSNPHSLYRFLQDANLPLILPRSFKSILFEIFKPFIYLTNGMGWPLKNAVQWNFQKFLIDRSGHPVANFASQLEPLDPKLTSRLEKELSETE